MALHDMFRLGSLLALLLWVAPVEAQPRTVEQIVGLEIGQCSLQRAALQAQVELLQEKVKMLEEKIIPKEEKK